MTNLLVPVDFSSRSLAAAEHATREGWNRAYYGEDVRAVDILITGTASNPGADALRQTVADIDTTSD